MRIKTAAALCVALIASTAMPAFAEVANDDNTLAIVESFDNISFARDKLEIDNRLEYWAPVIETLLTLMPDGSYAPNLATEWSYNEDNTVLTLKLCEGVMFTDGAPFNADVVKANIEFLRDGTGQNVWMAKSISDFEIVSPTEIKLILSEPDPALIRSLAFVGGAMASPNTLGPNEVDSLPVGTGPYVYNADLSVPSRQYVYTRNDQYRNPDLFPFDRITVTPMSDISARVNALKSGQVDVISAEPQNVPDAEANGFRVTRNPVDWMGLFLADRDGETNPAMADVRVRQAINMSIDRDSILKYVDLGYGVVTDQVFPKTSESYIPELEDNYKYDPEKAKALLAEAGYGSGLSLTLPEIPYFARYNAILEQQMSDVGVNIDWVKVAPNAYLQNVRSGKFGVFLMKLSSQSDWIDIKQLVAPDGAWNPLKTNDPRIVELMDQIKTTNGDEQIAAYQAVNRYLVENAWFAPWYRPEQIRLNSPSIIEESIPGSVVTFPRFYKKAP